MLRACILGALEFSILILENPFLVSFIRTRRKPLGLKLMSKEKFTKDFSYMMSELVWGRSKMKSKI
jgi:hypothetical protein